VKFSFFIHWLGMRRDIVMRVANMWGSNIASSTSVTFGGAILGRILVPIMWLACSLRRSLHLLMEAWKMKWVITS
jgi:hypothetical protein